jgi:YHS domain-containing protein
MDRYILSYKGREYSFSTDNEMKKYLKENGIEKKLNENNSSMMMVYNYVGKVATIKLIKKY